MTLPIVLWIKECIPYAIDLLQFKHHFRSSKGHLITVLWMVLILRFQCMAYIFCHLCLTCTGNNKTVQISSDSYVHTSKYPAKNLFNLRTQLFFGLSHVNFTMAETGCYWKSVRAFGHHCLASYQGGDVTTDRFKYPVSAMVKLYYLFNFVIHTCTRISI